MRSMFQVVNEIRQSRGNMKAFSATRFNSTDGTPISQRGNGRIKHDDL